MSDKSDYAPGEQVTLTGTNWVPLETVNIVVNDNDGQTWKRNVDVTADANGVITDVFTLPNWFVARYTVTATGLFGRTATATFTDAATDMNQCLNDNGPPNGSKNDGVPDPCDWTTGSVTTNNSKYTEGGAVAQRFFQTFDTAGPHSVTFQYDFTKNSVYTFDFLKNPNWMQSGSLLNPCGSAPSFVPTCSTMFSGAQDVGIPSDTFDNVASREYTQNGSRAMKIGSDATLNSPAITMSGVNGTVTLGHNPSTTCLQTCGDSSVFIKISFTTTTANQTVGLWFGAHLAASFTPPGATSGWGAGFGASSLSGKNYHVSLSQLDAHQQFRATRQPGFFGWDPRTGFAHGSEGDEPNIFEWQFRLYDPERDGHPNRHSS
jgi:hypothetical protein